MPVIEIGARGVGQDVFVECEDAVGRFVIGVTPAVGDGNDVVSGLSVEGIGAAACGGVM